MTKLFSPAKLGPLTLKNRAIRSAAFEGMCPNGIPGDSLVNYHRSVAAGGTAMTTVAYVSVVNGGRTFGHQAYMCPEVIKPFRKVTDAVHQEGGLASVQLGHGGNMGDSKVTGERAVAPSSVFNLYGLTLPRTMSHDDIKDMVKAHGHAVNFARDAGFDAVEIHAGHGYLISQFLSPYTNRRKDKYGGSFANRARFLREVIEEVKKAAGRDMAVVVKMNMEDGFKKGIDKDEGIKTAKLLENEGVDGLVLSGGFVSKASLFMLKGDTPHKEIMKGQKNPFIKLGMLLFSRIILEDYPYSEMFFLEDALAIRNEVSLPLVYVGGLVSGKGINTVLDKGFNFVQIARALLYEPDFINRLRQDPDHVSYCLTCGKNGPCNSCVATMYTAEAYCPHQK